MKSAFFYIAVVCALASFTQTQAQTADKERLKANLERAFSRQEPVPAQAAASPEAPADGILYYVQVLSSVRPLEGTGDKALKVFPDLKSYREDRYLKYYTGHGTGSYTDVQAQMRAVQAKGYPDAFIIAFKYGVKIPLKEALARQGKSE